MSNINFIARGKEYTLCSLVRYGHCAIPNDLYDTLIIGEGDIVTDKIGVDSKNTGIVFIKTPLYNIIFSKETKHITYFHSKYPVVKSISPYYEELLDIVKIDNIPSKFDESLWCIELNKVCLTLPEHVTICKQYDREDNEIIYLVIPKGKTAEDFKDVFVSVQERKKEYLDKVSASILEKYEHEIQGNTSDFIATKGVQYSYYGQLVDCLVGDMFGFTVKIPVEDCWKLTPLYINKEDIVNVIYNGGVVVVTTTGEYHFQWRIWEFFEKTPNDKF